MVIDTLLDVWASLPGKPPTPGQKTVLKYSSNPLWVLAAPGTAGTCTLMKWKRNYAH